MVDRRVDMGIESLVVHCPSALRFFSWFRWLCYEDCSAMPYFVLFSALGTFSRVPAIRSNSREFFAASLRCRGTLLAVMNLSGLYVSVFTSSLTGSRPFISGWGCSLQVLKALVE